MSLILDCHEDYRAARRRGQRYVSDHNSQGLSGYLPSFQAKPGATPSEFPLGTVEIPLSKIIGTYTEGRQQAFAGNFMPLLRENTEFSAKWIAVDKAHLTEGLRDPIKAYEYMGYVYVAEGNKRVSVLRFHNAYSTRAELIRLMPERDPDDMENTLFYEFMDIDRRFVIRHMWFSKLGRLPELMEMAKKYEAGHDELEESWLEFDFFRFREAYHALGYGALPITTGDAFWAYTQLFGFPDELTEPELRARLRHCEPQFQHMAKPELAELPMREKRSALFGLFAKTAALTCLFAMRGEASRNSFAHKHEVGRLSLGALNQVTTEAITGLPKGEAAYPMLKELAERSPDILFLTDPSWEVPAARLTLEYPDCMVLHCFGEKPKHLQATYYGRTARPAFLAGVLAGCLTRTGIVAYMAPDAESGALPGDACAFANGARLIHNHVRVLHTPPDLWDTPARLRLSAESADIIWQPIRPSVAQKSFVGLYAQLCALDAHGHISEIYAGACWDWSVFYTRLATDLLQGTPEPLACAYAENNLRLESGAGLLELCTVPCALGTMPMKLLRTFEELAEDPRSIPYQMLAECCELEAIR